MLSSDKNVESIAQLIEALKDYVGLQKEHLRLSAIEKVVHLVTASTLLLVIILLGVAILFYCSFAFVYVIAPTMGMAKAFLIVAAFFLLLLLLVVINRKRWIERPLVGFLVKILHG
ncbi:MAG: phage holin family protein [Prevotella sp.]|nr:phage holin family protein [Prevotella sp.]